jgi:hypothetical protein
MFSERFGKPIADHARERMVSRAISEVLLRDMNLSEILSHATWPQLSNSAYQTDS